MAFDPEQCNAAIAASLVTTLAKVALQQDPDHQESELKVYKGSLDAELSLNFNEQAYSCTFTCQQCSGRVALKGSVGSKFNEITVAENCVNPVFSMYSVPTV